MSRRAKGIILQGLIFVFFVVLAGNGVRQSSILHDRLLQLRDMQSAHGENLMLASQDVNDLTAAVIEIAKYARATRDKLEAETMLALPGAIDAAMESVVHISWPSDSPYAVAGRRGSGTGWVLDDEKGYVVTAAHVAKRFNNNTNVAEIELLNKKKIRVDKVWVDLDDDVAVIVLDVNDPNYVGITKMVLAEQGTSLRRGDMIVTLGGPFGQKFSAGFGIVSRAVRFDKLLYPAGRKGNRLQFDSTQNPGNSGGALVNIKGHVVGVGVSSYMVGGGNAGVNYGVTLEGIYSSIDRFNVWLDESKSGVVETIQ